MMLSEYGGTSYSFSGFYSFNSFDMTDFKDVLDKSLSAKSEENVRMMKAAHKYCSRSQFK